VLERLSPEERAAFLLRQVFDHDYDEIATMLDKSEAACRQMVHRAMERVQQERPRFTVPKDAHRRVIEKFMEAARSGQREAMKALLAEDVQLVGDGGGKAPAFLTVLHGADRVANLYWANFKRLQDQLTVCMASVNGEAGILRYINGKLESAQAFVVEGEQIVAIYSVRNPDKLVGVPQTSLSSAVTNTHLNASYEHEDRIRWSRFLKAKS
jgi:RNA polymerase sigma-70 factor (ECF subfamily)